jgi:type I restriction enzyme S subunit
MTNWKKIKLLDLGKIITGKTPSTKDSSLYNGNIPFVCIPDLGKNKRVRRTNKTISQKGANTLKNLIIPKDSVMVSCIATIGKVGIASTPSLTNQQINSIIPNNVLVDTDFLYYLLKNEGDKIGIYGGGGSVFNIISKSKFSEISFSLPDLPTQKSIAEILSSIDDKIELNNKINQELETLAQTLFKQWFIDFEFPNENGEPYKSSGGEMVDSELGEIPKGWDVSKVKDWGEVVCGKTPPKSNKEYFGEDVLFIKIPDMHNKVFVTKSEDGLSLIGANSQKNKLLKKGSVILSSIATVGLVSIVSKDSQTNQQINAIIPHKSSFTNYLFLILKTKSDDFKQLASGGSATLNMNTSTFKEYKVLKPIESKLIQFENLISSLFEKIHILTIENEELIAARDILLPKLISGELEIKEIFN